MSRGTGYWGPPMRLGAPAEITHLTLESGDAVAFDPGWVTAPDDERGDFAVAARSDRPKAAASALAAANDSR